MMLARRRAAQRSLAYSKSDLDSPARSEDSGDAYSTSSSDDFEDRAGRNAVNQLQISVQELFVLYSNQ